MDKFGGVRERERERERTRERERERERERRSDVARERPNAWKTMHVAAKL